eukprot:TRINITY_DN11338_c0_g1_i1.p1 TRINITY_DN11338_c0_g1~~TRINITY_DN11338_c0_g1_i1.p1  ORF type:complete len:258 (-),score=44.94 TRINITY_DN11338_c0_g1_i1:79-852(-)
MSEVVIVTGPFEHLAAHFSRQLHSHGIKVILVDSDAEKGGEALAKELEGSIFMKADITKLEDWQNLVKGLETVDYLVLDPYIRTDMSTSVKEGLELTADLTAAVHTVHKTIETNYYSTVYAIGTVLPIMERQGKGKILVSSSIAGIYPHPVDPCYSASKHAILAYMRAIKDQLDEKNINTYNLCAGPSATDALGKGWQDMPYEFLDPKFVAKSAVDLVMSGKPSQTIIIMYGQDPMVQELKEFVKFEGQILYPKIEP